MIVTQEINLIKKELKSLGRKVSKLNKSYEQLIKSGQNQIKKVQKKRNTRRINYIDWLNNERKMKELVSPK